MKPRAFLLCVDRFDAPDGRIWSVRTGRRWLTARSVVCMVTTHTVFLGPHARQPKAYLHGVGVVHETGNGELTIKAAWNYGR